MRMRQESGTESSLSPVSPEWSQHIGPDTRTCDTGPYITSSNVVKLRSRSGSGEGQLRVRVWKVRVRLGPAPESIPNDLKLSDTLFLVFTITLFHQLDQCRG